MNLTEMTFTELMQMKQDISDRNEHWKSCQDGSHGMALHYAGYYKVVKELESRQEYKG